MNSVSNKKIPHSSCFSYSIFWPEANGVTVSEALKLPFNLNTFNNWQYYLIRSVRTSYAWISVIYYKYKTILFCYIVKKPVNVYMYLIISQWYSDVSNKLNHTVHLYELNVLVVCKLWKQEILSGVAVCSTDITIYFIAYAHTQLNQWRDKKTEKAFSVVTKL